MTEGLEPAAAQAKQADRGGYVAHRAPQGVGIVDSPYLTVAEAARFCRFDATSANPEHDFRRWAQREAIPVTRRGRVLLFERAVLAQFLVSA